MIQLLIIIILILIFILIVFILCLYLFDIKIYEKNKAINRDSKVIDMAKKDLIVNNNFKDIYNNNLNKDLDNFFIDDVYINLSSGDQITKVENDYFNLFTSSINSILSNKIYIENVSIILDKPVSLEYNFYIPIIKFSKFSIDYDIYLQHINEEEFNKRIENYYNNFKNDNKYFVMLNKKRTHVLYFIQQGIELYKNYKNDVNKCIYFKSCGKNIVSAEKYIKKIK